MRRFQSAAIILALALVGSGLGTPAIAQSSGLLIENVTLIDGTGRPAVEGAHVLVQGDRIMRVSRTPVGGGEFAGPSHAGKQLRGAQAAHEQPGRGRTMQARDRNEEAVAETVSAPTSAGWRP